MASPVEAEDSDSEDAVLSSEAASEEEEDSAEVLLVFPPTMVLAEVQPASAESVSRVFLVSFGFTPLYSIKIEKILADFVDAMHSI